MDQLYFDGIIICSAVGFPDLFITFYLQSELAWDLEVISTNESKASLSSWYFVTSFLNKIQTNASWFDKTSSPWEGIGM